MAYKPEEDKHKEEKEKLTDVLCSIGMYIQSINSIKTF